MAASPSGVNFQPFPVSTEAAASADAAAPSVAVGDSASAAASGSTAKGASVLAFNTSSGLASSVMDSCSYKETKYQKSGLHEAWCQIHLMIIATNMMELKEGELGLRAHCLCLQQLAPHSLPVLL